MPCAYYLVLIIHKITSKHVQLCILHKLSFNRESESDMSWTCGMEFAHTYIFWSAFSFFLQDIFFHIGQQTNNNKIE